MNKTKKILLIGSSFSAAPILDRIRKRGFFVAVCGNRPNDPCHQYSDESHYIDYYRPEELLKIVSDSDFDYLVPSCNDYAYMSGAWVASQTGHIGFDKYSTAEILFKKNKFRETALNIGMPIPRIIHAHRSDTPNIPTEMYPVLIKPTDGFSGRGMTKVTSASHISSALVNAFATSNDSVVLIEEFLEGSLHSHSAFIANGKIAHDYFVDEFCTVYPYQVDCSNHPSTLDENVRVSVRRTMVRLIDNLKLSDGLLHTQFISNGAEHWIIETMRRCPGDLYGELIEKSTGIDYTDRYLAGFLGEEVGQLDSPASSKYTGRHTISVNTEIIAHSFSCRFPGLGCSIVPLKQSGELLGAAPYDKLAIVFNEFANREQMITTTPQMKDFVQIDSFERARGLT